MQLPPAFFDELRARLRPSDVIGKRLSVKSRGHGEYVAICPFHQDSDPSMTITDQKGFYHCFACGAHGDIIKFMMEFSGLSFMEAVKELAQEAGMPLPQVSAADQKRYESREEQLTVLDAAAKWFEEQLQLSAAESARAYVQKRGLRAETQKTFQLGYAPNQWDGLLRAMTAKNFTEQQLINAGLIVKKEETGKTKIYDRFRDRLMFPIKDAKAKVIAFGGRIIDQGEPKYLNSPETDTFHKGSVLYNWHIAQPVGYKKGSIAIVEGYMDVIALHQAGIVNVVSSLGTALTEQHLHMLWNVADEPVICMDGDAAGQNAMFRALEHYLPHLRPGKSLRFAVLPEGMDPDDVIKKDGVRAMREMLGSALSTAEVLWQYAALSHPAHTPEQRAAMEQFAFTHIRQIKDESVRSYYRDEFTRRFQQQRQEHKSTGRGRFLQPIVASGVDFNKTLNQPLNPRQRYEYRLLGLVLHAPELLEKDANEHDLLEIDLSDPICSGLRDGIIEWKMHPQAHAEVELAAFLQEKGAEEAVRAIKDCKFTQNLAKTPVSSALMQAEWQVITASLQLLSAENDYETAKQKFETEISQETEAELLRIQKDMDSLRRTIHHHKQAHEILLEDVEGNNHKPQ